MFTKEIELAFKEHALAEFPNEACGFVLLEDGKLQYCPKENKSLSPKYTFYIPPEEYPLDNSLVGILHSHPNGKREPSKEDMEGQIATAVPWGLVSTDGSVCSDVLWWGQGVPVPSLLGREFRHGPSGSDGGGDCYALIKDYYLTRFNIQLPEYPRTPDWWEHGVSMYTDYFADAGFERISESEIMPGDVFLAMVRSKVPNHGGIYIGDGLALHHLHNRLSKRDPIHRWKKYVTHWLRYVGK